MGPSHPVVESLPEYAGAYNGFEATCEEGYRHSPRTMTWDGRYTFGHRTVTTGEYIGSEF